MATVKKYPIKFPKEVSDFITGTFNKSDNGYYTTVSYKNVGENLFEEVIEQPTEVSKEFDLERLKNGLSIIANWELPPTNKFWDEEKTRPTSYETEYGSNGVRDFMKKIASNLLELIPKQSHTPTEQPKDGVAAQATYKRTGDTWEEVKPTEQPKERITVSEITNGFYSCELFIKCSQNIKSDKFPAIKQAIEFVLNNEPTDVVVGGYTFKFQTVPTNDDKVGGDTARISDMQATYWHKEWRKLIGNPPKYTQQQLDEAIEKAFNAARYVTPDPSIYGKFHNTYTIFEDYKQSLNQQKQ